MNEESVEEIEKNNVQTQKKFTKEKKWVNSWAKRMSEKLTTSFKSHFALSINMSLLVWNHCKKLEVKIFIKEKEKMKRIMMTTIKNIVEWVRESNINKMLSTCKDIETMKRWSNLLIFWVKMKDSKKILKENDFWVREMSLNISLHEVSFEVIVHEIRIKEMFKDIEKKRAKTLIKINKDIYSELMIKKIEWLTKKSEHKRYILLMIYIVNAELINKLINEEVCYKINIKITQFYNLNCRVYQCLKYQEYDYKTYECKNKQRCIYCMMNHRLKHCFHKQIQDMWKCKACKNTHKVFDS